MTNGKDRFDKRLNRKQLLNLLGFTIIQVIIALVWVWARRTGYYVVAIDVTDTKIVAWFDGTRTTELSLPPWRSGKIGLELLEPHYSDWWSKATNLRQSWESISVTEIATGKVLFEDEFIDSQLPGWTLQQGTPVVAAGRITANSKVVLRAGQEAWRNYRVEAKLLNGREAGIQVLAKDKNNYVTFTFRPFRHRDASIQTVVNGMVKQRNPGRLTTAPVSRAAIFLGKLLTIYFYGLLAMALASVVMLSLMLLLTLRISWVEVLIRVRGHKVFSLFEKAAPWVLALIASGISSYIILVVLEGIPHVQDSVAYLFQAKIFASGRLWADEPYWREFLWHRFMVLDGGKMYAQYPYGFPVLLALGQLFGAAWIVSPVLGGLSLLLFYALAKELYGQPTALLTGVLAVLSPFFLLMNGTFMSHSGGLFYTSLALYCSVSGYRRFPFLRGGIAGLAVGLLGATRPLTAPSVGVLAGIAALVVAWRRRGRAWLTVVGLISGVVIGALLLVGYNLAMTGNAFTTTYDKYYRKDVVGTVVGLGGATGITFSHGVNNLDTFISSLMVAVFPWPYWLVLAPMLVAFVKPRLNLRDAWLGLGFLGIVASYFFYVNAPICYGPRYYFEALPYILILSARGLLLPVAWARWILSRVHPKKAEPAVRVSRLLSGLVILAIIGYSVLNPTAYRKIIKDLRYMNALETKILKTVESEQIANAVVFVKPPKQPMDWTDFGSVFPQNSPTFDSSVVYARHLGKQADRLLLNFYPGRRVYLASYKTGRVEPYEPATFPEPRWSPPDSATSECANQIMWVSEPVRELERTTLVTTVAFGDTTGSLNLYVNEEFAGTLDLPLPPSGSWTHNDYTTVFKVRSQVSGIGSSPVSYCGILYLTVPAERLTLNEPIAIRIAPVQGARPGPLFILYTHKDTLAYEQGLHSLDQLPELGKALIEGFQEQQYPGDWFHPPQSPSGVHSGSRKSYREGKDSSALCYWLFDWCMERKLSNR